MSRREIGLPRIQHSRHVPKHFYFIFVQDTSKQLRGFCMQAPYKIWNLCFRSILKGLPLIILLILKVVDKQKFDFGHYQR